MCAEQNDDECWTRIRQWQTIDTVKRSHSASIGFRRSVFVLFIIIIYFPFILHTRYSQHVSVNRSSQQQISSKWAMDSGKLTKTTWKYFQLDTLGKDKPCACLPSGNTLGKCCGTRSWSTWGGSVLPDSRQQPSLWKTVTFTLTETLCYRHSLCSFCGQEMVLWLHEFGTVPKMTIKLCAFISNEYRMDLTDHKALNVFFSRQHPK